ncbi:MAG: hemerythrin domain-containing protein [Magnetospirillum sp.]|nr:MAG: hemerythrin domain-containing protein [Magnetospirillum sp.]
MRKTNNYRKHHDDLRAVVGRLEPMLNVAGVTADPAAVSAVVRDLFGKFSVHLAIEDSTLYPKYAAHTDARLRQVALSFQTEMGNLSTRFDAYKHAWAGPLAIGRDPAAFVAATREILTLLKARVKREEDSLYDLIDKAA